jgi:hypothetical protein
MNFGTIKDIFASILIESQLNNDDGGKKLYKKFIKTITEDEVLKSQFIVYKNIENKYFDSEVNASDYLKENISVLKNYSKKQINESNNKLVNILKESGKSVNSDAHRLVHKSLHTLITEDKNAVNVNKLYESFESVKDWLMVEKTEKEKSKYVREGVNLKKFLELVTEKYNEKYSTLTEEEKTIIKVLRKGDESSIKSLMSEMIKENISLINEHLDSYGDNLQIKEKLLEAKDVIYKMVDNDDSFTDKVLKLLELKNNLRDDS